LRKIKPGAGISSLEATGRLLPKPPIGLCLLQQARGERTSPASGWSREQVQQRVAHALLKLVKQAGKKTEEGILIDFPISRQDIAEMTGTTLHTVSRLLSAWEDQGLVKSERQKVTVVEPHRLLLIAEGRAEKS